MDNQDRLKYKNVILKMIKEEYPDINESKLVEKLNKATTDEIERIYDAIDRFGVKTIIDSIKK
jgi:hypothetical protein